MNILLWMKRIFNKEMIPEISLIISMTLLLSVIFTGLYQAIETRTFIGF